MLFMMGSHLTCGRVKGCVVKAREGRDQGPGASLNDSRACTCRRVTATQAVR
jgi:hypothetical protein